jgi:hypothetical protein
VKRAIRLLQDQHRFPQIDVDTAMAQPQPVGAIERAARFYVFWSERARASSEVARAWQAAVDLGDTGGGPSIRPVMLDHDRPEPGHPLACLETIDLGALADVLIVTAVKEEYEAVLDVDTGAVAGSTWTRRPGPNRREVAFRDVVVDGGVLRIAVTQAVGMGGVNAVDAAARLIDGYRVRCLAMCDAWRCAASALAGAATSSSAT